MAVVGGEMNPSPMPIPARVMLRGAFPEAFISSILRAMVGTHLPEMKRGQCIYVLLSVDSLLFY